MPDNECKWESKFITDYKCHEPPLPDGYCILHSKEDKDIKQLEEKVSERIQRGRLTPTGWKSDIVDLSGCYFPKTFPSNYFLKKRAFEKSIDFIEAMFSQSVNFSHDTFKCEVNFYGAKFLNADFLSAKFLQGTNFSKTEFCECVNFKETVFEGQKTDFREAEFKDNVIFSHTQFKCQEVSFSDTYFIEKGEVDFDNPHFDCQVYFIKTKFDKRCMFRWAEFPRTHKLAVFEETNLSKCSFLRSNVDKVDFRYCTFAEQGRRKNVLMDELECDENVKSAKRKSIEEKKEAKENYKNEVKRVESAKNKEKVKEGYKNVVKKILEEKKKAREEGYEHVRRVYLELKRNFEDKKDWNTAGDFHFGEMECRRKMKGWRSLEFFYWLASGYCERPLRTFLILIGFILGLFPLIYRLSEDKPFFALKLYVWDSVNVAMLLRLGDSIKLNTWWGNLSLVLEFILSLILIALLALALRRKVKR